MPVPVATLSVVTVACTSVLVEETEPR